MQYQSQSIRLQTDNNFTKRLPIQVCGDIFQPLKPLMTASVRMSIEGASTGRGRTPAWLTAVSDIRLVDYGRDGDDTLLQFDLPSLGEAAPELFEQKEFWETRPRPDSTALDALSRVVAEVSLNNPDSPLYDQSLLSKLSGLKPVFSEHLRAIEFDRPKGSAMVAEPITSSTAERAAQLMARTPAPREVRVLGNLDMIRKSTRSFLLQLDDDCEVGGVLESTERIEELRDHFGKRVLVLGRAIYRPSGSLLRIDAHAVEPGEGHPSIFSRVPPPLERRQLLARKASASGGWQALSTCFGEWPGAETNEEWEEMVHGLRK